MWLDIVKQGIYVNLDDVELEIHTNGSDDREPLYLVVGTHEIAISRAERDMFVALHEEAMDNGENVFSFDQDHPRFKMKLSGDEDEMDADVGLE